jgi:hypothetical protein
VFVRKWPSQMCVTCIDKEGGRGVVGIRAQDGRGREGEGEGERETHGDVVDGDAHACARFKAHEARLARHH